LGERGKLPVEVIPLAVPLVKARLREFGCEPILWTVNDAPARTDNGSYILDSAVPSQARIVKPAETDARTRHIPVVVVTGVFTSMAHIVLVGDDKFDLGDERLRKGL